MSAKDQPEKTLSAAPPPRIGVSIAQKLAAAISALMVVSLSLLSGFLVLQARQALLKETTNRGLIIVRNLASYSASDLLVLNPLKLATFVNDAMKNEAMVYAVLADQNGTIQACNDMSRIGQKFLQPDGRPLAMQGLPEGFSVEEAKDPASGRSILAFSAPVEKSGVKLGTAFLALSQSEIQQAVVQFVEYAGALALFFLVAGVLGAVLLSRFIVRPVRRLTQGALAIGGGNLETQIKVRSRDELGILASSFNQMTASLRQAQEELLEKQRIQQELSIAQEIQKALLPKTTPRIPGYQVAAFYQPAKEVGGDYYDFIPLPDGRLAFTVADVSGKGVPGSLGMTMARSVLRAQALSNSLPGDTLRKANEVIQPDIRKGMFVTMFYCVLDPASNRLQCANGGHNPAFVLSEGRGLQAVAPEGMALGMAPQDLFFVEDFELTLEPGSLFVLYTDGVTEAMNSKNEEYGEARFLDSLARHSRQGFDRLTESLVADITAFTQGAPQNDDITLVILRRAGAA